MLLMITALSYSLSIRLSAWRPKPFNSTALNRAQKNNTIIAKKEIPLWQRESEVDEFWHYGVMGFSTT